MKSLKRRVAETIKLFTKHMAILACGAASIWGGYQMKEPKNIMKK